MTLSFQTGGETWTVEKQFAGSKGSVRLRSESGISLQGDAAEDQLAEITANPDGMANRLNELSTRWSHLWVWQGTAEIDASTHAAGRRDELVQRLQEQGLAAVMQSETDERAREKVRIAHDDIFTRTGAVKTNSRLDLSTKSLTEANADLTRANEQKQRLESAVIEQESASKLLAESIAALPAKRIELTAVNSSLAKAKDLRSRHEKETLVFQNAATARQQIAKADQQIHEFLSQAAAARKTLAPAEAKLSILADQESASRTAAATAETAQRAVSDAVRIARQHHDLATACVSRFEKSAAHGALTAKAKDIATINEALCADSEALSKLPSISAAQLESLRKLETQLGQAECALAAIAAGIELVSSDQAVLLDGKPLETGKPRVITEATELTLGSGTLLRIQPGGGTSLAESRRKVDELRTKITTTLDHLAVKDPAEAAEIVTKRRALEQRIFSTESQLKALGASELPTTLAAATADLTAATADGDRRRAALPPGQAPKLPESLEAARTWLSETHSALQDAEHREQSLLADADAHRKAHQKKLQSLQTQRESLEAGRRNLESLETSARTLEQNHGDAATRAAAIAAATAAETAAKATLDTTNAALTHDSLSVP